MATAMYLAMSARKVEVKLLLNEHATHKYQMKKHLKAFMYDVKRRHKARIEAKVYTVSILFYIFSITLPGNVFSQRWINIGSMGHTPSSW